MDIFQTANFEKDELFILSLENGELLFLNIGMEVVFKVQSYFSSKSRFAINIQNPYKNETEGDFLIFSDGSNINVNMWIKKGTVESSFSSQRGGEFEPRGGQRGGRGGYKGGYRGYRGGGQRGGYRGDFQGGHGQQPYGNQPQGFSGSKQYY